MRGWGQKRKSGFAVNEERLCDREAQGHAETAGAARGGNPSKLGKGWNWCQMSRFNAAPYQTRPRGLRGGGEGARPLDIPRSAAVCLECPGLTYRRGF